MAAEPADLADSQPFSPSDFLNLPPTPLLDLDCPALQLQDDDDDLQVLPFISRLLMEEEMDGFFDPDHPALLQAQQPFADILSDATANSISTAANSRGTGSGTFTGLSPASAAGSPAFANATWPYDPAELSQLLFSRTYPADTATYPNADSLASSTMFAGGTVNMDMLNLAFLKGMEEANKFLPATNNSLLMPIVSGDRDGDHERNKLWRARQPKKVWKPQVDGNGMSLLLLQQSANNGSRGRKNNRHAGWGDDDSEEDETTGRRSRKLMAAGTEESEMVDEFIQSGYQSLHEQMVAMTISADDGRDADKKSTTSRKGKGSANEAVDLRTLLIHCAQAVAAGNRPSATDLLSKIRERSSPRGDSTQRLAHCFAKGLETRLAGTGSQVYGSPLMEKRASAVELLRAYQLYLAACCFTAMAFKFSNMAICKAIVGRKKVHIVDYGDHYGFQWPTLLGYWANREGGPPEVRFTAIDLPQPGFRPAARIQETGRRLTNFARRHGVPFRFHSIAAAKWETVSVDDLNIEHDEVLVVNGLFHFGKLMDEGADIDSLSPRDMVLGNIRKMRPDVFILCIENSSYNAPFFVTRFREALFFYSALFDMMDALAPRDSDERVLVEQGLFGQCALNAIACEGSDRVERPETYRQWQVRNERAGLRQLPLDPDMVKGISKKVKDKYHKDFVVDVDHQWLFQGWKGRILYAMSAWVANDNISLP
ncbi:unnamed protein product [Miscanthus lutarioriparius]|uniref:Scarecrow-like protein 9 n=1 Tax=Miscanthus lutarioriparius TaxID=422564 RepID=A0A811Q340_9POAL|nr:unnamed protein product [Miscanthus lutarioriparius]